MLANASRALPTLALLLIFASTAIGFGNRATVIAAAVFAIPPILTNTYTGVLGVDPDVRDAARGMGLTGRRSLLQMELPLAVPLVAAGLRTATVQVIATVPLAALVGGGGLGPIIVSGFANRRFGQVLAGAVLVALVCLLAEGLLALAQRAVTPAALRPPRSGRRRHGRSPSRAPRARPPARCDADHAGGVAVPPGCGCNEPPVPPVRLTWESSMHARRPALAVARRRLLALTAACGDAGSSGTAARRRPPRAPVRRPAPALAACEPVAGDALVVLEDDQGLQTVDNIIPAVNAAAVAERPRARPAARLGLGRARHRHAHRPEQGGGRRPADLDAGRRASSSPTTASDAQDQVGERPRGRRRRRELLRERHARPSCTRGCCDAAGYDATTQAIGNRETYEPALEAGELTVVPEYVGHADRVPQQEGVNGADATAVASADLDATVAELTALGEEVGLVFGTPSAAQDQNAFAVTTAFAEENGVATLSDLAAACGGLVLGGPPECPERPFCQPGLEDTYGLDSRRVRARSTPAAR